MTMTTTYAGMDAHARTIRVAVLAAEGGRPEEWQLTNEPRAVKRLAQRLKRMAPGPVVACYEAGPGGFALQRRLEAAGIECRVIAPALIPRRPGDRVKTDRRDARKLAELLRADLLTAVHPPTIDQEAVRDLCRAREDAVTDRTRARHRLAKLLPAARQRLRRPELAAAAPPLAADAALRTAGRAGHLRRLPARDRGRGGAAAHAGAGTGRVCRQRRLPRGGGVGMTTPFGPTVMISSGPTAWS